jgi:LPXTG-motif cell wall-anchored protein
MGVIVKRIVAISVLALACAGIGVTAASAVPPGYSLNPSVGVAVSSSTVAPGASLTVTGTGWLPASSVSVWIESEPVLLKSGVAVDGSGEFTTTVTVPTDIEPGPHTIFATGTTADGEVGAAGSASITVTGSTTDGEESQSGGNLADTGSNVLPIGVLGGVLLATGIGTVVLFRRRARA